ncbi:MAG: type II toxin-antitoxin system HicA family toxin [Candidatus Competibacteraceae bacterium]|nr:MAG: type II toxin-antitoxin system HicA family toxin [Candidatus Competibacteraceae bacterium]
MKSISGKAFARLLELRGWKLTRVSGSHHVYMKAGSPARISLPIHGNEDLKLGLLKHFMKVAGISENEL